MKSIELNNKKYIVPEKWGEVTLAMQIKVSADTDKIAIEDLKKFAILSGYANIPLEVLKKAKLSELQELFKAVEFINKPLPTEPIIEFEFKGSHYYAGQNIADMEFQDFISIENILNEYSGRTYAALPVVLAIMCKKKKDGIFESIDDYDIMQRAKEFQELPITIAHSLSLFFSQTTAIYSNLFQLFSNPDNQQVLIQKQIDSVESTLKQLGGMGLLTRLVAGMLRYSLKYTKRKLAKSYTSIQ